jgi:hypothetical protein
MDLCKIAGWAVSSFQAEFGNDTGLIKHVAFQSNCLGNAAELANLTAAAHSRSMAPKLTNITSTLNDTTAITPEDKWVAECKEVRILLLNFYADYDL